MTLQLALDEVRRETDSGHITYSVANSLILQLHCRVHLE